MTDHLLRPSLSGTTDTPTLYSPQSAFLLGFFLGPVPLILYSAINSVRLQRKADFLVYAAALALFTALAYTSFMVPRPAAIVWINDLLRQGDSMRGPMQIMAILLWCCFYLMHRKEHRAVDLLGTRPKPWIAAIICAVAGTVLAMLIWFLLKAFA